MGLDINDFRKEKGNKNMNKQLRNKGREGKKDKQGAK